MEFWTASMLVDLQYIVGAVSTIILFHYVHMCYKTTSRIIINLPSRPLLRYWTHGKEEEEK
jgi:hypothetical protein